MIRLVRLSLIFSLLLGSIALGRSVWQAKTTATIPRALLFGYPQHVSPKISPDGSKIAYLAPDRKGVLNVFIAPVDDLAKARKITNDEKRGISTFFWRYDSEEILYLQDQGGDENTHLYQSQLTGNITRDLTPFEGVRAEVFSYLPHYPEEMVIALNLEDRSLFDIYRLHLTTGAIVLQDKNPGNATDFIFDNDLHLRMTTAFSEKGNVIVNYREAEPNAPWEKLLEWPMTENSSSLVGFAQEPNAILLKEYGGENTLGLYRMDLATKEKTLIARNGQYDIQGAMQNPIDHSLEVAFFYSDRKEFLPLTSRLEADFDFLQSKGGELSITSRTLDDQLWVVAYNDSDKPSSYYLYDRKKQTLRPLMSSRPQLEEYSLAKKEAISFQARDGLLLHGYLTKPLLYPEGIKPAVLVVHGGPWARDTNDFSPEVQWLANRGYTVIQLNFRGSTGYGRSFLDGGNREWGAKMLDDLIDAKHYLIDEGLADEGRIAIYGGSYGGYATLAALAFTPEEFSCGVSVVGPSNLITLMQTLPPYWNPLKEEFYLRVGNPDHDEEFLRQRSPLFSADRIQKPLFLAHGANDPRVKQQESEQIVAAMRHHGLKVDYLLFTDEGHGFVRPANKRRFYAAVEDFFHRHLGGRVEKAHSEEQWESFLH